MLEPTLAAPSFAASLGGFVEAPQLLRCSKPVQRRLRAIPVLVNPVFHFRLYGKPLLCKLAETAREQR
jgi:hypothetical protein